jgi:ketosteroid isomerase-like protein
MAITRQTERIEHNKEIVRRAYDYINRGAVEEFGSLLTSDCEEHTPRGKTRDKAACLEGMERIKKLVPDVRYDVQQLIAEEDHVVAIQRFTGRARDEQGSRGLDFMVVDILRIEGNKIAELWEFTDTARIDRQLRT